MKRGLLFLGLIFLTQAISFSQEFRFRLKKKDSYYMPDEVRETSGLAYWNGHIITHNDSGGKNEVYLLDTLGGEVKKTMILKGSVNRDWESVYLYNDKLYVGDFGNNMGSRKNLTIYTADWNTLLEKGEVRVDSIRFYYPDQDDFSKQKHSHNFDCEAMVVYQDSIYLYSKSWKDKQTTVRVIPAAPGEYAAPVRYSFSAGGLITGAAFHEEKKMLVLIGYNLDTPVLRPFVWVFNAAHPGKLAGANGLQVSLSPDFTQIEGVTFLPSGRLAISAEAIHEKLLDIPAALFLVKPEDFFEKVKP